MFDARLVLHGSLIIASLLMASCGSNRDPEPPKLVGAASSPTLAVAEGADGLVSFEVAPPCARMEAVSTDGLEAKVSAPPCNEELNVPVTKTNVAVHAPYGVTGHRTIDFLVGNSGLQSHVKVEVDVIPASWSAAQTWTDGPEAREHAAVIPDGGRVIIIGGSGYKPYGTPLADVWAWSLTDKKWSKPAIAGDIPSAAASRRVAMDGTRAYLFGGGEGGTVNNEVIRVDLGDPITFTKMRHDGVIPARSLHAFVKAPDGFIVFGGVSAIRPLNDTWKMTVADDLLSVMFEKIDRSEPPSARYGFFYGADAEKMILFSGSQSLATVRPAEDAWKFNLATNMWSPLADANAPKGRRNGCFVYDDKRSQLFIFGGTADAMTTEPGFFVLDARRELARWSKLEREGEPPMRSSGFGFWDPMTRSATCGFGNTAMAVYADWNTFGPQ